MSTRAAYAAALMNDAWSQSDNPAAALVAFFGMMSDEQRRALRDAVRIVEGTTEGALAAPAQEAAAEEPIDELVEDATEVTGEVPDTVEAAETGDENPGSAQGGRGR